MATRKPLVMVGGKPRQLPAGDLLVGLPLNVAVGLSSGGTVAVALTAEYTLPVGLAVGGNVQVSVGG